MAPEEALTPIGRHQRRESDGTIQPVQAWHAAAAERPDDVHGPEREQHASAGTERGEERRLRQELADLPGTRRADCGPHAHLRPPSRLAFSIGAILSVLVGSAQCPAPAGNANDLEFVDTSFENTSPLWYETSDGSIRVFYERFGSVKP